MTLTTFTKYPHVTVVPWCRCLRQPEALTFPMTPATEKRKKGSKCKHQELWPSEAPVSLSAGDP